MLFDVARIQVTAGGGGDGCQSFRREAHVPKGGPDGGDGGHGGDVVLVCDDSMRDLQSFKRRSHYRAGRGGHGQGAQRHGADGETLLVAVPPGTQITSDDGVVHDLVRPGQRAVVARGGPGGLGNRHFATATRQAPRFAQRGLPGDESWLDLRLKLLADVGLVGLPNAGKSSLLARLTRAAPRVAAYPFTTLEPVLGTLEGETRQLVVADIPGLIEGASEGAGLGHEFLAHVERTRLLVHVLDLAPLDGSDPVDNHATVEGEIASHDPRLAELPRLLALSKADLVSVEQAEQAARAWRDRLGSEVAVLVTSSATRQGLVELSEQLLRRVPLQGNDPEATGGVSAQPGASGPGAGPSGRPPAPEGALRGRLPAPEELAEHRTYRPGSGSGFSVQRTGPHAFSVTGERVARLLARYDISNDEALAHVEGRLGRLGVIRALQDAGFSPGDDLQIAGVEFELDPE